MNRTAEFAELTKNKGPPRPKQYTPLDDATSIVTKLHKMKSHLARYGHDYLNTYSCLPGACIMTDERRNKLDKDVEEFIEACNDKVNILKNEIKSGTRSDQVVEHRKTVIQIVMRVLNDFVSFYAYLRGTRMKRLLDKDKYDRIETSNGKISPCQEYQSLSADNINLESLNSLAEKDKATANLSRTSCISSLVSNEDCVLQSQIAAQLETNIQPEEIQMLAQENSQMLDELLTLDDEIKSIGKKVVQISKLQELFTEKVMEQESELNILHETAIKSSENVREANDMIRDAMMKNASTRVFILFYIITLGFTILFLDWYNP